MGNIRTKDIKDAAASLYRSSPEKFGDFEKNKKAKALKEKVLSFQVTR